MSKIEIGQWSTKRLIEVASRYESVLDIGCGKGGLLARISSERRVGIDACPANFASMAGKNPEIEYIEDDVRNILFRFGRNAFECIVGMDIIEHLYTVPAVRLLQDMEQVASRCILLFVPVGYHPQDKDPWDHDNDFHQTHKSIWHPQDLIEMGYSVTSYRNWYKNRTIGKGAMWCVKQLD